MAKRTPPDYVIDLNAAIVPDGRGVRGRIEKLFQEYAAKAQALRMTAVILDEEDRKIAAATAPKKFLAAVNHRNGAAGRAILKAKRGRPKTSKAPIHGARLSLFLLEHLSDETPTQVAALVDALAAAGSPVRGGQALNGPLGANLGRRGYVKKTRKGIRRTARGTKHAAALRQQLEAAGVIAPGGYGGGGGDAATLN